MAESETGEKTEQATSKKKEDARRKGQMPISREVPTAAMLLGAAGLFLFFGPLLLQRIVSVMRVVWGEPWPRHMDVGTLEQIFFTVVLEALSVVVPFVALLSILAAGGYLVQLGFIWKEEGIKLDLKKLSPLAGLKRIFSIRSVVEMLKSFIKLGIVAGVGYGFVHSRLIEFPALVGREVGELVAYTGATMYSLLLWMGLAVALLAGFDYLYQRWQHERDLLMSIKEVKDELKQTEGDPLLKARIRSLQRERARQRMMEDVPKADVVITNPLHIAVALRYEQDAADAPLVLAKGAGVIAERIKAIARTHHIHIVENKLLARAIFKMVKIGHIIPVDLYKAVAEILAYVYQLKGSGQKAV